MKHPFKVDVPVLITFFTRPETLKYVFESVKNARPSVLLLWQDGPRKNRQDDIENIAKCRAIVEDIDWECTVYKNYHNENMGCDPSTFLAQKWAFEIVDKCIIMEDDRVPVPSFYQYCKELLDKYEFDERISHICGTNLLGIYTNCPNDYLFSPAGSTTWASWRRVAKTWDETYSYLKDPYTMKCLESIVGKKMYRVLYANACRHAATGFQWWETILGMSCILQNKLAIIPKMNMIKDLGLTENATHAIPNKKLLPKVTQNMFYMKSYDVEFPIKHPKYVIADKIYYKEILKIGGLGYPWLRLSRKIEYLLRCIRYGEFNRIIKALIK